MLQERILLNIDADEFKSENIETDDVTSTSDVTPTSEVTPTVDVISNVKVQFNCSTKSDAEKLDDKKALNDRNAYIKNKANSLAKWHYLEGFALETDLKRGNFKTFRQGFQLNTNNKFLRKLSRLTID